jgi:threonine dehydratase
MQFRELKIEHVYSTRQRIGSLVRNTMLEKSPWLGTITGGNVLLKLENQQESGSFKIRGAANKLLNLNDVEKSRGVITVSSGNHGRAVSYVANKLGVNAVICLSKGVPEKKVHTVRELGAEIVIVGSSYMEAADAATQLQAERSLTMMHPFDDPYVIAGQGTIGVELMEEFPQIDTVIVPLSGGGLLGGIALTLKSLKTSIHVVGVSQEIGPAMVESLKAGRIVDVDEKPSLADALIGGIDFDNRYTFNLIQEFVDETVLVSEHEIAAAMAFALDKHHLVVEGGGAVGIAALLYGKVGHLGKNIVVVVSGGNVELSILTQVAQGTYEYQQE